MLEPKRIRRQGIYKTCSRCGLALPDTDYVKTNSYFYQDGYAPFCNHCIKKYLEEYNYSWTSVDRLCQFLNIPFIPRLVEETKEKSGEDFFPIYAALFISTEYEHLNWDQYQKEFLRLQKEGILGEEIPLVSDQLKQELILKWGGNYDDEALYYLEEFLKGLQKTYNITNNLQLDQALKICKISYEIDVRIRAHEDFDKLLGSYDKLIKTAEFNPRNTKNSGDIETIGELFHWLEKRGFKNKFYDDVSRDIVDETIKNIQSWNQKLYINETGISEEINRRIEALKTAAVAENYYETEQNFDADSYDNDGFEQLMMNDDFLADEMEGD